MKPQLTIATRNQHKVEEIQQMLPDFEVRDLGYLGEIPEVEETGTTFLANATLKAEAISALCDGFVLSDDSGLEVDALDGAPGVYSARYAGEDSDDARNNRKLLEELAGVENRRARFRSVLVFAKGGVAQADFEGAVEGHILTAPSGESGFGYDPLFVPVGHEKSFAELGEEVKNSLSHRANALEASRPFLDELRKSI